MTSRQRGRLESGGPSGASTRTRRDELGPQGAALIAELQRLQQAFDQKELKEIRDLPHGHDAVRRSRVAPQRPRPPTSPATRSSISKLARSWLDRVVSSAAARPQRKSEAAQPSKSPAPPRGASSAHPIRLDVPTRREGRFEPGNTQQPGSRSEPQVRPGQDGNASFEIIVGQVIQTCRAHLVAGVAFLVSREGIADNDNLPGESLRMGVERTFVRQLRTGLRVLIVGGLVAFAWIALMPLAGAVVVPGNLVVQSNVKTIQHPTGGVVAQIAVSNGMRVKAGDLLVRLDATQANANAQMLSKQLDEVRARIARLLAERDGLSRVEVPAEMSARSAEVGVTTVLASEASLFKARANARESQKDLLQHRISQLNEEITGLNAQIISKANQLELISRELSGVQELYDKRLVPLTRLTTLQRETARIEGERGQLTSAIAETNSKIGEARLQIVKLDQDFRTEVVKELGETQGKEAELVERSVASRDLLDRIEIRAPSAGVVHQLSLHTLGGVVRAGEAIMELVPDSDELQIEARLQPNEIDHVRTGQKAFVRFSAFNQRVTPQLSGTVYYVSADTSHDQQATAPYFTVRIALSADERGRLAGLQLVPGMPAEVFMQTGSRTMLSYLLKPITDQMQRAFVEQ